MDDSHTTRHYHSPKSRSFSYGLGSRGRSGDVESAAAHDGSRGVAATDRDESGGPLCLSGPLSRSGALGLSDVLYLNYFDDSQANSERYDVPETYGRRPPMRLGQSANTQQPAGLQLKLFLIQHA